MSLDESIDEWVKLLLIAAENPKGHHDMKQYIIEANYDMDALAKKMEEYYINKVVIE